MNIYDWKMINIFLIILGFAFMLTIWSYEFAYPYIPNTLTYMLTGMCGGMMIMGTIICRLKMIQIIRYYEDEDNGQV